LVNRFSYSKKVTLVIWLGALLCIITFAMEDLHAQSNAPSKLKTEQKGKKRRLFSEKKRKNSKKGAVQRRGSSLQKSYFKKRSKQTRYPGNVWINPKPKDFTAIKERVERNPSRKNMKAQKSRKSYFRASSNRQMKSYGSDVVLKRNQKLSSKYASRAIIKSKGKNKIKPLSSNYRKSSRKVQKHTGSIFLKPETKKRDYNEIKARVERNPGRSMAKRSKQQKNRAISNATLTQTYRGNINVKIDNSEMISEASGYVNLIVEDTGIGIDSNETPHIFERFFQAYHAPSKGMSGTGIGLSLVRDFVKMHAGKTEVESQKGKGARFIVSFPLGKEHLSADHIVDTPGTGKKEEIKTTSPIVSATHLTSSDGKKPILLLVDDHPDMLQYISQRLRNHFEILTATDGEEALNLAKENIPDLIISDVMMPHMDGYELCEHIKTEPRTSHIPVILLTAKTDKGSKLHGLHKGADDYVDKPFDMDLLAGRALNLINQRQKLSEIFRKDLIISTDHKKLVSNDEKLLKSIIDIIEQHLDSTALNVEFLAREAGLSRTQLYRKIVGLTNQKPTEFIRTIRLKHAYQMLQADHGNVSEVAYAVGFNNLSYFSECFKKQYNMTPNESKKLAQS